LFCPERPLRVRVWFRRESDRDPKTDPGKQNRTDSFQFPADDSFSTDTSVALIMAKTASPFLRFIRVTEPVVMIEVTGPAPVLMTISETTLSDTIYSIVPGK